jgi:hypothetical protein
MSHRSGSSDPLLREFSRIEINTSEPLSRNGPNCPRCGSATRTQQGLVHKVHVPQFTIDFVFQGWFCKICENQISPHEVRRKINELLEARWVALGILPPVDVAKVEGIRERERERREAATQELTARNSSSLPSSFVEKRNFLASEFS